MKLFGSVKPFNRADRLSGLIQQITSETLQKFVNDPRLELVTITGVKMTRDLKLARLYFSTFGSKYDKNEVVEGLNSAIGYIKRSISKQLSLRYMPELRFYYDESFDYGSRIDKILKSIN